MSWRWGLRCISLRRVGREWCSASTSGRHLLECHRHRRCPTTCYTFRLPIKLTRICTTGARSGDRKGGPMCGGPGCTKRIHKSSWLQSLADKRFRYNHRQSYIRISVSGIPLRVVLEGRGCWVLLLFRCLLGCVATHSKRRTVRGADVEDVCIEKSGSGPIRLVWRSLWMGCSTLSISVLSRSLCTTPLPIHLYGIRKSESWSINANTVLQEWYVREFPRRICFRRSTIRIQTMDLQKHSFIERRAVTYILQRKELFVDFRKQYTLNSYNLFLHNGKQDIFTL